LKSLMLLWIRMADESAIRCCTCATLDIKYARRRFEHEGLSFLTITLPDFGKDLQKGLERGQVDRNLFQGFPWQAGLPRFLGGFLDLVFDRCSGALLNDPSPDAILAIRQLTLMFNKISLECTKTRQRKAMDGYIQCEKDVREADALITCQQWHDFDRVSALLYAKVFSEVDREIYLSNILPKHGPGSTAERLRGNSKYRQKTWPARLESYFPMGEYLIPNYRYYGILDSISVLEPDAETPVRVVSVPKTQRTPRIIGIEPVAMQYCQQALNSVITSSLERNHYLSRMIGFKDQDVNQRLALKGSLSGDLATLDLSEASDRVSNQHVRHLLRNHIHLHDAVDATRSRKADVSGHGVVRLAKYASMGSALCFPVEAMVFLTMIFIGIEKELSSPLSPKVINDLRDKVRVYGDDIIVPVEFVRSVISVLESFGIRVNRGKSFWNGKFRESCGKEYFNGFDVSIVRVRQMFPTTRKDATEIQSIVSLRNQLYWAGYWSTVAWLDEFIRDLIKYFPVVLSSSRVIGRESALGFEVQKTHDTLHSPLVKGYVSSSTLPADELSEEQALLKCLLRMERRHRYSQADIISEEFRDEMLRRQIGSLPAVDDEHLKRAGRPQYVGIKLRWASPI